MKSFMFYGVVSLGNYTLDLAICIAALIYPLCLELKLYKFSSIGAGYISESFTFFKGTLEVAVFLSHIFRFFDFSFASYLFYFSVSLVINTSSSFGGLNGEYPIGC